MRLAFLACASIACSKSSEAPPPAPAKPVASVTVAAPKVVKATRKIAPESVSASSEYKKPNEQHLAEHAFDGDTSTAWTESAKGAGAGEWLEAKLHAPRHLRRVGIVPGYEGRSETAGDLFVANAHVKLLRIRFDDDPSKDVVKPILESERAVSIELDRVATKVRFIADEVHAGTKWEDLSIAEIDLYADDEIASGHVPPKLEALDAQLSKLDAEGWKASTPEPAKLLATLGFSPASLETIPYARVDGASRTPHQLDDDTGEESILQLVVFNQGDAPNKTFYLYFWAFLDDEAHQAQVLGRRSQMTVACKAESEISSPIEDGKTGRPPRSDRIELETKRLHDPKVDDVIVRWLTTNSCADKVSGTKGAFVATLARGALDIVASWSAAFDDQKPALAIASSGDPPARLEIARDGVVQSKLVFDPIAFRYR